jgi:hypothetical protein
LEERVIGAGGFGFACVFLGLFHGVGVFVPAAGVLGEGGLIGFGFVADLRESEGGGREDGTGLRTEWKSWETH